MPVEIRKREPVPEEYLPADQTFREANRLTLGLINALLSVPDFQRNAAHAYVYGSGDVVFHHGEKDYRFFRRTASVQLQVGNPGTFDFGGSHEWEEEISIATPWGSDRTTRIQFSRDMYADFLPPINTTLAVQNIERIIQTLKPVQAPTPPPGPNLPPA